ncbi:MAG: sensor histidine kinase, partial [Syntrophothermus sp.]
PLRHIGGFVDLLSSRFNDMLPDKARHYLKSIAESSDQMGELIDDLLQFSRTGRQEMKLTELDMNSILHEALGQIKRDNQDREIEWITGSLPNVYGDYSMLRLVWVNLLSNAAKYTRKQVNARVEVSSSSKDGEIIFAVRDNGVGFDMQYAHKLFGVFQRLHSVQDFEGTGIGLANVQRIILKHGGRVWAEAEPGKGAAFYFTLPKISGIYD